MNEAWMHQAEAACNGPQTIKCALPEDDCLWNLLNMTAAAWQLHAIMSLEWEQEGNGVRTCLGKGGGAQQEVGAGTADEAHDIVGRLQVVPEADVLMVQHIIRPVHPPEHLHRHAHTISLPVPRY